MFKPLPYFAALIVGTMALSAVAAPEVGKPAPNFTATDTNGNTVALDAMKGDMVVLEWTNHKCPFVVKHYKSGNMQQTQKTTQAQGVKWVTVISSAVGKQGYVTAEEANDIASGHNASPDHILLDPEGEIGRKYGAKTTPHMYVIDADGTLAYMGAIDNKPTADPADVEAATNYVLQAVASLKADDTVEVASSRPYGCSVKY